MTAETAEAIALFRYRVIAEAIGPRLSPAERGSIVRTLAHQLHEHPDGSQRQYSRGTLDRWLRAYREQGLDGLKPDPRADRGTVRRYPELLDEACALRVELPTRSAAQIGAILYARHRIHAELANVYGVRCGRKRVARLMRIAKLRGVCRPRRVKTTRRDDQAQVSDDLVQRQFKVAGPNK